MKNPIDKFSIISYSDLLKVADDAALHRYHLEHLEAEHLNNPHKYTAEEQGELKEILELVIATENEIHAELQCRESRQRKQWI